MMINLKKWLNKNVKPTELKNEYTPAMGVNDAYRKQQFTNYNVDLMNRIRDIKLNENK